MGVELGLLTNIDILQMIGKGIRNENVSRNSSICKGK